MAKLPSEHDVAAFWTAKGVSDKCELCGADQWHVVPQPLLLQAPSPLAGIVNRTMTVMVTGCGNCGNLRMMPLGVIELWLKERK